MARTKVKPQDGAMAAIMGRTCCRRFSSRQVTDEQIGIILKAGQAAPSAANRQPYEFIVIRNKDCLAKIEQAFAEARNRNSTEPVKDLAQLMRPDAFLLDAPVSILVVRSSSPGLKEFAWHELDIKEDQGVAATIYSMMLAAHSIGLASCWVCTPLYTKYELRSILKEYGVVWKEGWEPRVLLPIGHPLGEAKKPQRKDIKDISHFVN